MRYRVEHEDLHYRRNGRHGRLKLRVLAKTKSEAKARRRYAAFLRLVFSGKLRLVDGKGRVLVSHEQDWLRPTGYYLLNSSGSEMDAFHAASLREAAVRLLADDRYQRMLGMLGRQVFERFEIDGREFVAAIGNGAFKDGKLCYAALDAAGEYYEMRTDDDVLQPESVVRLECGAGV